MSFIDLTKNHQWSEADILAHVRAVTDSIVPAARQKELQTIMIGHIAQMRDATPIELAEIAQVKDLVEQGAVLAAEARADMALLLEVMAHEADNAQPLSDAGQALFTQRNPVEVPSV